MPSTVDEKQCGDNIILTLKQPYAAFKQLLNRRCAMVFQRCFSVEHQLGTNVVQRWESSNPNISIFNAGPMFFQRQSTTLKQRWSTVNVLSGSNV